MKKAISKPQWQLSHEARLLEWQNAKSARMPMPDIPKIPADIVTLMPTRDGVGLYTEIFLPPGNTEPAPAIVFRTPYPDSTMPFSQRPIELFRNAGYVFVAQSCRGTWKSEGKFRFFQNEPEDGFDCIEWVASQPWANGKVGMYGSSYSGSAQWMAAKLKPPHLTCIAPQSPGAMFFYETPYCGGVFVKNHILTWPKLVSAHSFDELNFDFMGTELPKGSPLHKAINQSPNREALQDWLDPEFSEAICEALEHSTLDDWWERIMLTEDSATNIDIPVLAITGFHDGDQAGSQYNWDLVEAGAPESAHKRHLIIGPWRHAQMATGQVVPMGEVTFGENASFSLPQIILEFYDAYLKGDDSKQDELPKRCQLYTSGSNRWHECSEYPPAESALQSVYLSGGGNANSLFGDGELSFEKLDSSKYDVLPADWENPVPVVTIGCDASTNEARHDVLVYTSAPLVQDFTVLGQLFAEIYMSVDAPDADIIVRVEDVYPDGRAINMTGEAGVAPFRARYRNGFDQEVLIADDEVAFLSFHVCHMGHTFKQGHRLRISLAATAENLLEPNHHTGEPVLTAVERKKARQVIYHGGKFPSRLLLPVFVGEKD